jgi:uncharacterized damage-inducible protein DinB
MPQTEQADNSVLTVLFHHNSWANLKLLDFCENLSDEQLDASATGTYGSIRDTLNHMVRAEVTYVNRVTGKVPPAEPVTMGRFPGFEVMKQTMRWTGDELLQLALSARADTIVREEEVQQQVKVVVQYKVASLMMQAINHATEHRAQVSAIITQLGLEPPNMDGWQYMEDTGEFQEFTEARA